MIYGKHHVISKADQREAQVDGAHALAKTDIDNESTISHGKTLISLNYIILLDPVIDTVLYNYCKWCTVFNVPFLAGILLALQRTVVSLSGHLPFSFSVWGGLVYHELKSSPFKT